MNPRLQKYFDLAVAMLCIADLLLRLRDFSAHYTESGVVPFALRRISPVFQLEFLHASASGMAVLFAIALISAMAVAIVKKSLFFIAALWVAMLSIQARNTYIGEGFDVFIRIVLFWLLLFHLERSNKQTPPISIVKIGYLLQMVQVYLCSGIYKLQSPMWQGDALRRIFQSSIFPRSTSQFLLDYPAITTLASQLIPYVLIASAILLLIPNTYFRRISVVTIVGFHAANAIFLDVGLFSLAGIVSCLPLLGVQTFSLSSLKQYLRSSPWHPVIMLITIICSTVVIEINAKGVFAPATPTLVLPLTAVQAAEKLGFRQRWSLFTDVTREGNGYFEVRAQGATTSRQVFSEIPDTSDFSYREVQYPSHRWKKFLLTIEHSEHTALRQQFAAYLCRNYAVQNEKIVIQFHSGRITKKGKEKLVTKDWALERECQTT